MLMLIEDVNDLLRFPLFRLFNLECMYNGPGWPFSIKGLG